MYLRNVNLLQVLSSIVAAWADVNGAGDVPAESVPPAVAGLGVGLELVSGTMQKLDIGYMWMLLNCLASAAYVRLFLPLKHAFHLTITAIGASHAQTYKSNRIFRLGNDVLQQFVINTSPCCLLNPRGRLELGESYS